MVYFLTQLILLSLYSLQKTLSSLPTIFFSRPEDDLVRTESSNNNPRALGHRRMRSHPEYLRWNSPSPLITPSTDTLTDRLPSTGGLHVPPHQLRSVRTSPIQLVDHVNLGRTQARQLRAADCTDRRRNQKSTDVTNSVRRKPHQTHRRLSSASAALMSTSVAVPDASMHPAKWPVPSAVAPQFKHGLYPVTDFVVQVLRAIFEQLVWDKWC